MTRQRNSHFTTGARICMVAVVCAWVTGCAPRTRMSVLIKMIKQQDTYFRDEVAPVFAEKNRVGLEVVSFGNVDSIEDEIVRCATSKAGLVKVPFDRAAVLVQEGKMLPLDNFLTLPQVREFTDTYVLTALGKFNGKYYYVPRKYECRILVYCRSKAADAVARWRDFKDSIDTALKQINGYGLPAGYTLEEDPNQWDYFDIFAAGWVWAHTPYDGTTMPRVAHRGRRYSGTSLRLVDRVFQCGGDSTAVLTMQGDAVVDAFAWEASYAWGGIYNPRMWTEGWSGTDVWRGFGEGTVFLALMTQLDCFFIHGTGRDSLLGYLKEPEDMGVAVMPQGCSITLDANHQPERMGRRSVTTGGWWWGIPTTTPDPKASYALARHIAGTENQIQECSRFGMIPVRKDILSQISLLFGGGWISEVYEVSFRQLVHNGTTTIPSNAHYNQISGVYLDAWYDMVVGGNWSANHAAPQQAYIAEVLATSYVPKVLTLLKGGK